MARRLTTQFGASSLISPLAQAARITRQGIERAIAMLGRLLDVTDPANGNGRGPDHENGGSA